MFFWRVGGHGCNGRQGEFELAFNPAVGANQITHFDYDSHDGLEISDGHVYPGKLVPKSPQILWAAGGQERLGLDCKPPSLGGSR